MASDDSDNQPRQQTRHPVSDVVVKAAGRSVWLRRTLGLSQKEAVASATMTATGDNFFNAFAVYLQASALQMGWLTAIPQLFGALSQILSAWLGNYLPRKPMVVITAMLQALVVSALALLAILHPQNSVNWLIALAVLYFACTNFIQPQWRAWMGSLVPQRRRGAFFAARTRLTMIASLIVFAGGGVLLNFSASLSVVWVGFALLFSIAAIGRTLSARLLHLMHDPDPRPHPERRNGFRQSMSQLYSSLHDKTFRDYSFFVAGMQGVVAISAPFFAVYMLSDLGFSYLQYSLNAIASIVTQFLTLGFWGRFTDKYGNRIVMQFCCFTIPLIPVLWMLSPDFYYLLVVQMVSGFVWSAFSLSTANYLYDIRPHRSDFAVYAATQSALGALAVFVGAIGGGLIAAVAPDVFARFDIGTGLESWIISPLFLVFAATTMLRLAVALWFVPRAREPRIRRRPGVLQLIYRISRFNAITGVSLDWLSVTRKSRPKDQDAE
ncbi:MFS transporter [Pseudohongiella spirulinae]|uniref:MFS transporter n=1 Tax=Pseudohongiella spirulinae TaxID=1249552 RepID=UPI0009EC9C04